MHTGRRSIQNTSCNTIPCMYVLYCIVFYNISLVRSLQDGTVQALQDGTLHDTMYSTHSFACWCWRGVSLRFTKLRCHSFYNTDQQMHHLSFGYVAVNLQSLSFQCLNSPRGKPQCARISPRSVMIYTRVDHIISCLCRCLCLLFYSSYFIFPFFLCFETDAIVKRGDSLF